MNIQHLRYAVEVERTGSITEAAENLYITQPSLSKAIRELESGVGIAIFERTPRGVIPTRKGRTLLEHARAILRQVDEIEALSAGDDPSRQAFSIVMPCGSYIAEGAARFAASLDFRRPICVKIQETDSAQAVSSVAEGRFRMGIVRYPAQEEAYFSELLRKKGLKSETVWEFDRVALISTQNPLAEKDPIEEADLSGLVEITHADARAPYLSETERTQGQTILVYGRSTQFELLSSLSNAYMWASPMPPSPLARYALVQRRCPGASQRYRDVLIYPRDYRFTDCDRLFIDRLFEVKNEVAFASGA